MIQTSVTTKKRRAVMISILLLLAFVLIFTFVVDADFITYAYHLYRTKYKPNCFKNQTIWVVGASSGLGEHIVYQAASNGAKCIIISSRRKEQLQRVAETVAKSYSKQTQIIIVPFDILSFIDAESGSTDCQQFIKKVITDNKLTDIDHLVMNTGISARALGMDTELSVLKRLIDLNVFGIVVFVQSFIRCLRELSWIKPNNTNRKTRGIYITSSIAGLVGSPGQVAYAASKHAINGFMKSLRYELVRDNVHIGLVCPGPFRPTDHSHDGLGASMESTSGRMLSEDLKSKKMTSQRAAELYVTCMTCQIGEAWLTYNPILLFTYVQQYLPFMRGVLVRMVGPGRVKKILHKQTATKTTKKAD